jgi:NADH dehydrogenase
MTRTATGRRPRVVIIGGGFGGLAAAQSLRDSAVDVIMLDKRNHHLFQPLLYQVAAAGLSPANIASPLRSVLDRQQNCRVYLEDVTGIDLDAQTVSAESTDRTYPYDYLILAAGVKTEYFGHHEWKDRAPGLKSLDDALEIRRRVLLSFEQAELDATYEDRRRTLTFVIVGGGPTGVELAGAFQEIASEVLHRSYHNFDTSSTRIILIHGGSRLLKSFPEELAARAQADLEQMGVEVWLDSRVTHVGEESITLTRKTEGNRAECLDVQNVVWAAGVRGVSLAEELGAELDDCGRVIVNANLSVPNHPAAFVIGDLAHAIDAGTRTHVPGVAQGAIQMGRHVARQIANEVRTMDAPGTQGQPFIYTDKGSMATIGRNRAVAVAHDKTYTGHLAWFIWAIVHIMFLIGHRNRIFTLLEWVWMYITFNRGARLITGAVGLRQTSSRRPNEPTDTNDDPPRPKDSVRLPDTTSA